MYALEISLLYCSGNEFECELLRSRHFSLSLFLAGMFPALLTLFSFTRDIVFKHFGNTYNNDPFNLPFVLRPLSNISVNSQSVSKKNMHFSIGIYSNPIEPMYSIGPTFYPNIHIIRVKFLSLTRTAHKHFHWNLFVSDRSDGFHRFGFLHQYPI